MNRFNHKNHLAQSGSAMIEALLGLGLTSGLLLPLIGLFALGLTSVEQAQVQTQMQLLYTQMRELLNQKNWPTAPTANSGQKSSTPWERSLFFNDELRLLSASPQSQSWPKDAIWRADLRSGPGLGWQNDELESVNVRLYHRTRKEPAGTTVIQRHRPR